MNTVITTALNKLGRMVLKKSPEILTAVGIGGFVASIYSTVKGTVSICTYLQNDDGSFPKLKDLKPIDIEEIILPAVLPPFLLAGGSIFCIVYAQRIGARRQLVLASLYGIAQESLEKYQQKVRETIGERKESNIKEAIYQDQINKNPPPNALIIQDTTQTLCLDVLSGRYFLSSIEKIKAIQNEFNRRLMTDMYITLNDLYSDLGLDGLKDGDLKGWSIENGLLEFNFDAKLTANGQPCVVVDYKITPNWL
jgi:hypothetical protein